MPTSSLDSVRERREIAAAHVPQQTLDQITTTRAPIGTRLYRSMTSILRMRIQPDDTEWPIFSGSLVPWIRYSVSLLPSKRDKARAPSGLSGPPGNPPASAVGFKCGQRSSISAGGIQ